MLINLKLFNCATASPQNAAISSQNIALLRSRYDLRSPLGFRETTGSWLSSPAGCCFPVSWAGSSSLPILSAEMPHNEPSGLLFPVYPLYETVSTSVVINTVRWLVVSRRGLLSGPLSGTQDSHFQVLSRRPCLELKCLFEVQRGHRLLNLSPLPTCLCVSHLSQRCQTHSNVQA